MLIVLLTGCGQSPEEKLKIEIDQLQAAAVESFFEEKIASNSDATIYGVPGKELLLITRTDNKCSSASNNLELVTCASYYNVNYLKVYPRISYKGVQKYKKSPYTYKALLQLDIDYEERNSAANKNINGIPGIEIHLWTPENYTTSSFNKKKWEEHCLINKPVFSMDHAFVFHNILQIQPRKYHRTKVFDIFYNAKSKKWELTQISSVRSLPPPPVYLESKIDEVMAKNNYKKYVGIHSDQRKVFWFSENDYLIAKKGLVKFNGTWKSKSVIEQTLSLQKIIEEWEREQKISFKDLQFFITQVKNNPLSENRDYAIKLIEDTLINVFIAHRNEFTVQYRNWLLYLWNFVNENHEILDRETITREIRQKIDFIDHKLKKACKTYVEELMKVKTLMDTVTVNSDWKMFKRNLSKQSNLNFIGNYATNNLSILRLKEFVGDDQLAMQFQDTYERIDTLKKIIDGDQFTIQFFLNKGGRLGQYCPPQKCSFCLGTGKKNCSQCKNSGICALCNGKGVRCVMQKHKRGWATYDVKVQTRCNKSCTYCAGQTVACTDCSGKGIVLNKVLCISAFNKEKASLKAIIKKIIAQLNSAPKSGNFSNEVLVKKTIFRLGKYQNVIIQNISHEGIFITHQKGSNCLVIEKLSAKEKKILAKEISHYTFLLAKKIKEQQAAIARRKRQRQREQADIARQRERQQREQATIARRKRQRQGKKYIRFQPVQWQGIGVGKTTTWYSNGVRVNKWLPHHH